MDRRNGVQPLLVSQRPYLSAALAGVAKIKEQAVVTQAVAKNLHGKHFNPGAVEPMAVDDGAAGIGPGRNVPALQQNAVRGMEFDGLVCEAEGLRRFAIITVREAEPRGRNETGEKQRHDNQEKNRHQAEKNEEDVSHDSTF